MEEVLIHFRLVGDEAKALLESSIAECRRPREQVRYILRESLKERGLLKLLDNEDDTQLAKRRAAA